MLWIDDRVGSVDLYKPLKELGLHTQLTRLAYGDLSFEGKGPKGSTLDIGIELKRLSDLVQSLRSGRLTGHQLPGLLGPNGAYDYVWLVVEGQWHTNPKGQLLRQVRRGWAPVPVPGGMSASEMEKTLLTLELCGGLHVRFTNSRADTLHFIHSLYRWFTDKAMDKHSSHLQAHTPASFLPVSEFRATVQRFPHIGPRTSLAVESHFGASLRNAVLAPVDDWAGISILGPTGKPRRLGLSWAQDIVDFCKGGK